MSVPFLSALPRAVRWRAASEVPSVVVAVFVVSVETSPFIKVHRVTDSPPPPFFFFFFFKSKFNFSRTVGEMVFVSFEVARMRMCLVQSVRSSLVLCLSAVAGCRILLSRVKPLAKRSIPVSAGQLAEL